MVFSHRWFAGGQRTKAGDGLYMPGAGRLGRCQATRGSHMDDWLSYLYALTVETLQRDVVPDLMAGRAVTFTMHVVANQPIKFECSRHFKDRNWPPPAEQKPRQ